MRMPSVMKASEHFARTPRVETQRSQFDRSHGHKTTFDAGYLIPVYVDEVLPGDTFNLRMTAFCRLSTPVKPIMDNLYMESFFFFVPYRLVWENFVRMCGEQDTPASSTSYTFPQSTVPVAGFDEGGIYDYLGIPPGVGDGTTGWTFNALPVRAYWLIYNEWFRDQNILSSRDENGGVGTLSKGDGPDSGNQSRMPARRGKRHDYFTSALPWAQKGDAIDVPYGDVISDGNPFKVQNAAGTATGNLASETTSANPPVDINNLTGSFTASSVLHYGEAGLEIDPPDINELREAFQIQRLLEKDARGGTRYPEIVKSHFNVHDPQMAVLQRPEYLGGGSTPVVVNAVAQTSETNTTEQGNLAGVGTAVAQGHGFAKSFTEHGVIIGLVSVRADLTYQQGLERMYSRSTRYDMFWPSLANLGEQAILNKEIFIEDAATDDDAFGYQERWSEYRYKPSRISGEFRSEHSSTLEVWHLAQHYATCPSLDSTFIYEDPDMARILASSSNHHFLFDSYFNLKCARAMPMYSVPGMIDHF